MVQSGLHTMVREMIDPSLGAKPDAYGPAPGALVQSYVSYPGGENVTDWNLSQGWAAGGIISTASDLRLFLRALAHGMVFARPEPLPVMADFFETEAIRIHNGSLGYARGFVEYGKNVWGHGSQTLGYEACYSLCLVRTGAQSFLPMPPRGHICRCAG